MRAGRRGHLTVCVRSALEKIDTIAGGVVMPGDREQLLSVAREVVSAGLRAPSVEDRTLAALLAIREHVAPSQMEAFWVALIEHSINTISPFLAVYGDEFATKRGTGGRRRTCRWTWSTTRWGTPVRATTQRWPTSCG